MAQEISRYQRVIDILDRAAGDSEADYGGVGVFWRLPRQDLLEVCVHGVRLIAPEQPPKPSCCGGGKADGNESGTAAAPGRGDSSGLVQGLRGDGPFDGSQFPRIPWGGAVVSDEDIAFISEWIDDGCPAGDRVLSVPLEADTASERSAQLGGELASSGVPSGLAAVSEHVFEVFQGLPQEHRSRAGQVRQRMNIDCLNDAQLSSLRRAMRGLYALNKWPEDRRNYNNLALIHQSHCQHGWERFLPWHRIYLYEFEQALEDICPGVSMPYWDWTMPQYCPERPEKGWRIPKALQAYLTKASIDFLTTAKPKLTKAQGKILQEQIVDQKMTFSSLAGFFAKVAELIGAKYTVGAHRERFIDALLAANALWYPLRYPGEYNVNGKPSTINRVIHYHYPTADDMAQVQSLRTFRDFGGGSLYNDSFGFLDQNPHNTMHIWTGGMNPAYGRAPAEEALEEASARSMHKQRSMQNVTGDVGQDRNRSVQVSGRRFHTRDDFYVQQQFGDMFSNLTAAFDPVFWPVHANVDRTWNDWQQVNPHSLPVDLDSVLTPWSYTIADTLDMSRFGYEYVRCAYLMPVGLETPVGRFVSQPIDVSKPARTSFERVEVRLHRVPQLPRSCFIRVFLNQPGSNASTPLDGPHYAGYLAVFGHGACYGGPGHCELPPVRPRSFDLRPRNHNTPRNHRIDVTKSARQLLDQGATSLQITLVVIGVDYNEDTDLLRLDGVSLNFLD